jgi:3-hydroxyisobutyrate dehydrogenase-like beta-hydroxyacid dehydrogenase
MNKLTNIAFLGLGTMGTPMARRIATAGYPLTVWNRTPKRAQELVALGATLASTPAAAVADADVVITMLADPAAVREVYSAFVPALRPGTRVVDASTIGPDALREVARTLPRGVTLVDAPVMGSSDRAANGELSLLVGGSDDDVNELAELLGLFGTVTRTGETGTGAALKLVLIGAVVSGVAVIGEAMVLADSLGLPEDLVKRAMAASPLAGIAGRSFVEGSHFPIRLAAKDVALGAGAAKLPLAAATLDVLSGAPGLADEDLGQIIAHIRAQSGTV